MAAKAPTTHSALPRLTLPAAHITHSHKQTNIMVCVTDAQRRRTFSPARINTGGD